MRVALVHDWLTGMRGGEKVLEVLGDLYPDADVYTLVYVPERISPALRRHKLYTSFIDRLPFGHRSHQLWLPLFPLAVELWDFSGYDLVVSSSHCVAKGAIVRPETLHVCYCHTPMRYAWDFHALYREAARPRWLAGPLFALTLSWLRTWDVTTARRPHHYVANSHNVARRIERYYGQTAEVVPPPVSTDFYTPSGAPPGDHWLVLSAMVPYKRLDAAIEAFNRTGRPLHVVGEGTERRALEALARPNVRFLGWLDDEGVRRELQSCRGLVFPGEEDFGITPLEANACGRPVVAYRRGGVLESQVEGSTAVFFDAQEPDAIAAAVDRAERLGLEPGRIRAHAEGFSRASFRSRMAVLLERRLSAFRPRG